MTNIVSTAKNAVEHRKWVRWLNSLDDIELQQTHDRFVRWRDNPEGDTQLSTEELNKKIAFIKNIIDSR